MSQAGILNDAGAIIPGSVAEAFVTDSGTAIPVLNVLNVVGTNGATTSGSGSTVTINPFNPNRSINISDDFIGVETALTSTALNSQLSWFDASASGFIPSPTIGDSGHWGVIGNQAFAAFNAGIFLGNNVGAIDNQLILGGGAITLNWVVKIAVLSTGGSRYTLRLGLGDTRNADQANGLYFEYSDNINSGNWVYKSAAGSVRTTSNSSTLVTTGYHNFQITINAAASTVSYSVDGVSLGTNITTNIPTLAITPFIDIVRSIGTIAANTILIDLFYMSQALTTAR